MILALYEMAKENVDSLLDRGFDPDGPEVMEAMDMAATFYCRLLKEMGVAE